MKNLLLAVFLLLGIASCTPVKYVMIDPKDSTKLVEVRKRIIYDDSFVQLQTPMFYWNRPLFYQPLYIPFPQRRVIVTPQRPVRPQQPNWRRPATPPRVPRNR
jgi:hypothetical protein